MTVAGLRFDSLADMPEGMRKLAADKIVSGKVMGGPDKALDMRHWNFRAYMASFGSAFIRNS